jgi:hypothetical protein
MPNGPAENTVPLTLIGSLLRSSALRAAAALGLSGVALACGNLMLARALPRGRICTLRPALLDRPDWHQHRPNRVGRHPRPGQVRSVSEVTWPDPPYLHCDSSSIGVS